MSPTNRHVLVLSAQIPRNESSLVSARAVDRYHISSAPDGKASGTLHARRCTATPPSSWDVPSLPPGKAAASLKEAVMLIRSTADNMMRSSTIRWNYVSFISEATKKGRMMEVRLLAWGRERERERERVRAMEAGLTTLRSCLQEERRGNDRDADSLGAQAARSSSAALLNCRMRVLDQQCARC